MCNVLIKCSRWHICVGHFYHTGSMNDAHTPVVNFIVVKALSLLGPWKNDGKKALRVLVNFIVDF